MINSHTYNELKVNLACQSLNVRCARCRSASRGEQWAAKLMAKRHWSCILKELDGSWIMISALLMMAWDIDSVSLSDKWDELLPSRDALTSILQKWEMLLSCVAWWIFGTGEIPENLGKVRSCCEWDTVRFVVGSASSEWVRCRAAWRVSSKSIR